MSKIFKVQHSLGLSGLLLQFVPVPLVGGGGGLIYDVPRPVRKGVCVQIVPGGYKWSVIVE